MLKVWVRDRALWLALAGLTGGTVVTYAAICASADARSHSFFHLIVGGMALGFVLGGFRPWVPRGRLVRVTRVVFIVAALVFAAGQIAESIGAFGWVDAEDGYPALTWLHDTASRAGTFGLFVALICIPWLVTAAVTQRTSAPIVIILNVGLVVLIVFVFLAVLLVRALGDAAWFTKGQVISAPCEEPEQSSTIVEKDLERLETRTGASPVPGAQVEMFVRLSKRSPFDDPLWVEIDTTDSRGWFEHEGVAPADRFGLRASAPGFKPAQRAFLIKSGPTPQAFEVTLRPEGC